MKNNKELIGHLKMSGLETPRIISAFEAIDRANFVTSDFRQEAYEDHPLLIPGGQTISQPYTVAFMLELLGPKEGDKVLDVGSGSGWTTALLSHIVGKEGEVIGTEIVPELIKFGRDNLAEYDFSNSKIKPAKRHALGSVEDAPFDRILVSADSNDIPQELLDQLKPDGILVIPVRNMMYRVKKTAAGDIKKEEHGLFSFVPLIQ